MPGQCPVNFRSCSAEMISSLRTPAKLKSTIHTTRVYKGYAYQSYTTPETRSLPIQKLIFNSKFKPPCSNANIYDDIDENIPVHFPACTPKQLEPAGGVPSALISCHYRHPHHAPSVRPEFLDSRRNGAQYQVTLFY